MLTGYVAFLDVLGFSSLVSGDRHADRIAAYLNSLCTISDPAAKTTPANAIEYVVFSDSIIITTKDDSDESFELLLARCSLVFGALLQNEISVRGAIAHGTFMREKTPSGTFVAGRAIVEAYQFEEKQDWIGIMVSPSVRQRIPDLERRCLLATPGPYDNVQEFKQQIGWAPYLQRASIPFHGEAGETVDYEGLAVVPSTGNFDPKSLTDSLGKSLACLRRLKSIAPDPPAQQKHTRTIHWLSAVWGSWAAVVDALGDLQKLDDRQKSRSSAQHVALDPEADRAAGLSRRMRRRR
jgi:hypothetical protein